MNLTQTLEQINLSLHKTQDRWRIKLVRSSLPFGNYYRITHKECNIFIRLYKYSLGILDNMDLYINNVEIDGLSTQERNLLCSSAVKLKRCKDKRAGERKKEKDRNKAEKELNTLEGCINI